MRLRGRPGRSAGGAALACLVLLSAGCAVPVPSRPQPQPVAPTLLVALQTPDSLVGVYRTERSTHLVIAGGEVNSHVESGDLPTVHLVTYGGETGMQYNSFVYGRAPLGATHVELAGIAGLGAIENGVYVLALQRKDLRPDQLNWRFLRSDGSVVKAGSNITP